MGYDTKIRYPCVPESENVRKYRWEYRRRPEVKARRNARNRQRYAEDPEYRARRLVYSANDRARVFPPLKALIAEAKAHGCSRCPESDASCLDFHHIDPETKDFNICDIYQNGPKDPEIVAAEIAKCEVICGNCHRKHHASRDA